MKTQSQWPVSMHAEIACSLHTFRSLHSQFSHTKCINYIFEIPTM